MRFAAFSRSAVSTLVVLGAIAACSAGTTDGGSGGNDGASTTAGNPTSGAGGTPSSGTFMGTGGEMGCFGSCSPDLHQVLDCEGNVVATCDGFEGCNPLTLQCANACSNAAETKQSVGCDYWAVDMDQNNPGACFAAYVANTWNTPVKISVEFQGQSLDPASFARIPQGQGPSLTYQPYDALNGLPPGEVAILFLSGDGGSVPCPAPPARPASVAGVAGTGIGNGFSVSTDVPVVMYQMNPYGGGGAAVTAASLLLPVSAWDTNYIAVNVTPEDIGYGPSMNIVAAEDNTVITMLPNAGVVGGGGVPSGLANTPLTFTLNRGQQAQITQSAELTGSAIQSDKPIGFFAGQPCMRYPIGVSYCDHGEQMIPPIRALGNEYVAVMHRPRTTEPVFWRIVGAVDGTQLTYSSPVGGPAVIDQGMQAVFPSSTPFTVKSQDAEHPFMLFGYMTSSTYLQEMADHGDPDMVLNVPVQQYMSSYVFFTDPTYPETNLVVVRAKQNGTFRDVDLDCAGTLGGWQPVGDYEWTRIDLMTGDFQPVGGCSTGRHEMASEGPFGLWVWGWGTPFTNPTTQNVSYGYPAGMNVIPINDVVIPPIPR